MPKRFIRIKEDFTCENCGFKVRGSGYTNHCPKCLWSKHVDINPGDRSNKCEGMMVPVGLEQKHNTYYIFHRCNKCKLEKKNKAGKQDDFDKLLNLARS
ncbi:MAG: RNHCP domain-containing protein [Candidatus Doudnabacteria bacterium]|nr:RNHCP domain-containing protein [Candidatus Doudnabacteria bacterium]